MEVEHDVPGDGDIRGCPGCGKEAVFKHDESGWPCCTNCGGLWYDSWAAAQDPVLRHWLATGEIL